MSGRAMRAWVGITDHEWFRRLAAVADLDEVNFWQPGGRRGFASLRPGELFLFKLHSPLNFIVGGGVFAHATQLPLSWAWDSFGEKNGARSLDEMRAQIQRYRRDAAPSGADPVIGCIVLTQPFFLPEGLWIPAPSDWKPNIVQGKTYDLAVEPGLTLHRRLVDAMAAAHVAAAGVAEALEPGEARYGRPALVAPRLGQGAFRVMVTDAYGRRCAVTGERVLPALEAAHIRPFAEAGPHRIDNGLPLRRDVHALFDLGYLTVTPALHVEVSGRLREEWQNGREYYAFHGSEVLVPADPGSRPAREFLEWHNERKFRP